MGLCLDFGEKTYGVQLKRGLHGIGLDQIKCASIPPKRALECTVSVSVYVYTSEIIAV